jgi:hypothetical protein
MVTCKSVSHGANIGLVWEKFLSNFEQFERIIARASERWAAAIRAPADIDDQLLIALLGYALIANNLASYTVVALWLPAIHVIMARSRTRQVHNDNALNPPQSVAIRGALERQFDLSGWDEQLTFMKQSLCLILYPPRLI